MSAEPNPGIDFLVRQRYEQRVSVRRLAKRTGLPKSVVREVEHGDPTVSAVQRYARGLGLSFSLYAEPEHRCPSLLDLIFAAISTTKETSDE